MDEPVTDLTIRWTMGDWPGKPFHPQAYTMLSCSVAWARHVFPKAQLVVTTNSLTRQGQETVDEICARFGARAFPSEPWIPNQVAHAKTATSTNPNDRNTWWKLAPLRLTHDEHELVLDNDVVLWREPAAVTAWLADRNTMLGAGSTTTDEWTSGRQSYGSYSAWMRANHPDLTFSSGLIGWPAGMTADTLPHPLNMARTRPHYYSTEQGFVAMQYLNWPGPKTLLPWASVPNMNDHNRRITAERVLTECDGAHFTDHNVGRSTRFTDEFEPLLTYPPDTGPAPQRPLNPTTLTGARR
jgi:hypothetical protein